MVLEYTAAAALGTVRAAAVPAATQTAGLSRGIEQDATYAPLAADQLDEAIGAARVLVAVELVAAVRAIRIRGLPTPGGLHAGLADCDRPADRHGRPGSHGGRPARRAIAGRAGAIRRRHRCRTHRRIAPTDRARQTPTEDDPA